MAAVGYSIQTEGAVVLMAATAKTIGGESASHKVQNLSDKRDLSSI